MAYTPVAAPDAPPLAQRLKYRFRSAIKDNFKLSTLLLFGALLHGIASLILPNSYALLPVVLLLVHRILDTILMCYGVKSNPQMEGVVPARYTAQIPGQDNAPPTGPSEEDVVIFILATRSNHPLGLFGPGFKETGQFAGDMIRGLNEKAEENGFLGTTSWQEIGIRETSNQIMTVLYFRSVEHVHQFAHDPIHRKGWEWWNNISKTHPHLSIMHEMYHAPKKHWESIYVSSHLTGLGATCARMNIDGEMVKPVFEANRGVMRTSIGRVGRGTGDENDKYENPK